jgi:hypothetical protein
MRKIFLALFVLITSVAFSQENVKFNTTKHNFGKIKKGTPVSYTFSFLNTGTKPLVVEIATAECGCTTPDYPKQPIAKGKEGKIKVTFNAALSGAFHKNVTVKFANIDNPVTLNIEGEVFIPKS